MVLLLMMGATTFASYHFCKKGHNDLLVLFCFTQQPVLTVNKQSPTVVNPTHRVLTLRTTVPMRF